MQDIKALDIICFYDSWKTYMKWKSKLKIFPLWKSSSRIMDRIMDQIKMNSEKANRKIKWIQGHVSLVSRVPWVSWVEFRESHVTTESSFWFKTGLASLNRLIFSLIFSQKLFCSDSKKFSKKFTVTLF